MLKSNFSIKYWRDGFLYTFRVLAEDEKDARKKFFQAKLNGLIHSVCKSACYQSTI